MIRPDCAPLVAELERLCPGTRFVDVTDDVIRMEVPQRYLLTSAFAGISVPAGVEIYKVDLRQLGETPEFWLHSELMTRKAGWNPDLVVRDGSGEVARG